MVAGCLLLQLSATAHLVLVEHEICPEHGEAVDVSDVARASVHQHAAPVAERSVRVGGHASSSSHEHCPVAIDRSSKALVAQAVVVGIAPSPAIELQVFVSEGPTLSASAVRLLAPKTSPPA